MSKKLKLVIATTTGFHLRHLARELIGLNQDVAFISYLPNFRAQSYGISKSHHLSLFAATLPTSAKALFKWQPAGMQRQSVEKMLQVTDDLVAERMPDCDVFLGLSGMSVASARRARSRGALTLIDRGALHVESQAEILSGSPSSLSSFYIERELDSYAAADIVTIPSAHVRDSFLLRGYAGDKLFTNPLGVDTALFAPCNPDEAAGRSVIFAGTWGFQKGSDLLAKIVPKMPDVNFVHAGSVGDLPLPKQQNFTSLGRLSQAALAREMRKHSVLVLPSRQDGFGMVLMEGVASGLKIVASSCTGVGELVSLGADAERIFVCLPGSEQSLFDTLRTALRTTDNGAMHQRNRLKMSWRAYSERFLDFVHAKLER